MAKWLTALDVVTWNYSNKIDLNKVCMYVSEYMAPVFI